MQTTRTDKSTLRDELRQVFEKACLPSSPDIAVRILKLIEDPNSSALRFAEIIQADPALAVRLLKLANSARYAQREPVATIQRAVTVVGLRQLRLMALGFELVSHLDRVGDVPFDLPAFWQQSVLRACLARAIARHVVPELAEEAFLVGLLQECGILLLVQVNGREYADLCCHREFTCTAFYAAERTSFEHTHVDAIGVLAEMWGLPETIARPMAAHHRRTSLTGKANDIARLSAVSYFVGGIAFVPDGQAFQPELDLREYARKELRLGDGDIDESFAAAESAYEQMRELFHRALPRNSDVAQLLQEANRQLQREVAESERRIDDAEAERDEMRNEQETLRNALGQYREIAAHDPLTGLLNRRALIDATIERLTGAASKSEPVLVMFLDLDNFKQVNDTCGHLMGDAVLKAVAGQVERAAGARGVAGRYGGEEFILVLTGLAEPEARARADQLVELLRSTELPGVELPGPITGSVGAVWREQVGSLSADALFAAADEAMYEAKGSGKDRYVFRTLPSDPDGTRSVAAGTRRVDLADDLPVVPMSPDHYRMVAEALEADRCGWALNDRKQKRRALFAPCLIRVFVGGGTTLREGEGYVRNISSGGVGLLARSSMMRGDLIEVGLELQGRTWYLAGIVAFCKFIDIKIHAVGVQLFQRSDQPVFRDDYDEVVRRLDWIDEAVAGLPPETPTSA